MSRPGSLHTQPGGGTPGVVFQCGGRGECPHPQSPRPLAQRTILALLGSQLDVYLQSSQKSLGGGISIINWGKRTDYAK